MTVKYFRLMGGVHTDKRCATKENPKGIFEKGDIIACDRDLDKLHGKRFKRELTPPSAVAVEEKPVDSDPLESMTVKELLSYAEENEIEVDASWKKSELITGIRGVLEAR